MKTPVESGSAGVLWEINDVAPSLASATDYRSPDPQGQDQDNLAERVASTGAALPGASLSTVVAAEASSPSTRLAAFHGRGPISSRDPRILALWEQGLPKTEILRRLGKGTHSTQSYFGARDPTPQPLGCPFPCARLGETAEQRAWRRFPIDSHKPATQT